MNNILDRPETTDNSRYLRKSARVAWAYLVFGGLHFLITAFIPMLVGTTALLLIPFGMIFFVSLLASPFGLYYSWQSKRLGEDRPRKRRLLTIIHAFAFTVLLLVIARVVMDLLALMG